MDVLTILKIIVSALTVVVGAVSLIWPRRVTGFTGLRYDGPRGITEIRSILGAFFIGLGAGAIYLNDTEAYLLLGVTYLVVALVRLISMFVDKSVERSNVISFVSELIFGVILVL
jgi:hypothetical protein